MKRFIVVLFMVALLVGVSSAQSGKLKTLDAAYFQTGSTHYVTLSFTASPDAAAYPTLTYNVYRQQLVSKTSVCSLGSMQPIGNTATTSYADTNVQVGAIYCYAVTATLNGGESDFSNTASATIPIAPPSGLVGSGK
jgi:fibronectin type 3 domain-containing protein